MRARALAAAAAAATLAGCGAHARPAPPRHALGPDRVRYELDLAHAPGRLGGSERIAFRNPFATPLDHVWVRAWANAFGSCAHPRIVVSGRIAARRRRCTALRIDLPS